MQSPFHQIPKRGDGLQIATMWLMNDIRGQIIRNVAIGRCGGVISPTFFKLGKSQVKLGH